MPMAGLRSRLLPSPATFGSNGGRVILLRCESLGRPHPAALTPTCCGGIRSAASYIFQPAHHSPEVHECCWHREETECPARVARSPARGSAPLRSVGMTQVMMFPKLVGHPGLLKYPSRGKHAVGADPVRCCSGTDALWPMPIRASMTPANRRIRFCRTTLIMKRARFSGSVSTAQQAPRWP